MLNCAPTANSSIRNWKSKSPEIATTLRRGCRVHYCFFNLGGAAHEIGVRQVAHYLWNRFGSSHRVRFVAINFEPVVGEILEKIDDGQMGVILKRMMVRAYQYGNVALRPYSPCHA